MFKFWDNLQGVGKVGFCIAIMAIVGVLIWGGGKLFSGKGGIESAIASAKKAVLKDQPAEVKLSADVQAAAKNGLPVLNVGVNPWGGYAPGLYYNNGLEGNTTGRYAQDGVIVNFVKIDEYKSMRDAWRAKSIDICGLATADSMPTEVEDIVKEGGVVFMQVDWSRKGDVVVATNDIKSIKDVIGKEVAFAELTPSQSLLFSMLRAGNVAYDQIKKVPTENGTASAQIFKSGKAKVAVVWAPDDKDCIKAIPGAHKLFDTGMASNIIADTFLIREDFLKKNPEAVKKFVRGWFIAAAEINSNPQAKDQAADIINVAFKVNNKEDALEMINNARLSTYGDNKQFFGLEPGGTKGEELYNKFTREFEAAGVIKGKVPPWRQMVNLSVLQSITDLNGPEHAAEGTPKFSPPTPAMATAPALAEKPLTVQFEFNSAKLTEDGKVVLDTYAMSTGKEWSRSRIRAEGNTDSVGSAAVNKKLSKARAKAAVDYLVEKYGFSRNRFIVAGNGSSKPAAGCENNNSQACMDQNRRTEFIILAQQ